MRRILRADKEALSVLPGEVESWVGESPASRCGYPLRGFEEPVRDAGCWPALWGCSSAAVVLPVRWAEEVCWLKVVRIRKT
jgi:hypothetical protein